MGDYQAHRAAVNSPISTQNVDQLAVAWAFPITTTGPFGAVTSVPIVVGDTIYLQDMQSNVYALDRNSGQVKWTKEYNVPTEGPNGVAIGYGML
jgi:glucose dehydrogenase